MPLWLVADPPGPPSAPTASDVTKDSCTLTWAAPESDGGTEIVGYHVERCLGQSSRWIRLTKDPVGAAERTYAVRELIEDNVYEFRVYAVNKVGDGPVGPSSEPVTARDPWGTSVASGFLVDGQVTIIFVVSVCLLVCLSVCLFVVQSFSQPSSIRFGSN